MFILKLDSSTPTKISNNLCSFRLLYSKMYYTFYSDVLLELITQLYTYYIREVRISYEEVTKSVNRLCFSTSFTLVLQYTLYTTLSSKLLLRVRQF